MAVATDHTKDEFVLLTLMELLPTATAKERGLKVAADLGPPRVLDVDF